MISLRSNSHVFTAQHSGLPEKLKVVKVIRSPSGPIAPGESRDVAERVQRMGELWLKEVKIHSQLSQHVSTWSASITQNLALHQGHGLDAEQSSGRATANVRKNWRVMSSYLLLTMLTRT